MYWEWITTLEFKIFVYLTKANYVISIMYVNVVISRYVLDAVRSSRILIGKQKLGRTFNSDKLGGIAFTKISKLTMCSAYEEAQAIVPASTG